VTRVRTSVRKMMTMTQPEETPLHAFQPAASLLPRFEAAVAKLRRIADINRAVHQDIYNRLIGEAAVMLRDDAA
jgi:hypothetical protein